MRMAEMPTEALSKSRSLQSCWPPMLKKEARPWWVLPETVRVRLRS